MWRALFFAVGAMLILLGVECLVVDQYLVSQRTRIPDVIAKMLDNGQGRDQAGATAGTQGTSLWGGGNSRFQASPYSPQQANNQSGYSNGSTINFAGFGRSSTQTFTKPTPLNPQGLRVVQTKDWMPWSLLAAGTLVVLYTNSTRRSFSKD